MKTVTCTAPVNIAVIKYWGKRDTKLILPTNDSLSVTLSQDDLHSKTTISASPDFSGDRLWLNGKEEDITKNKRMQNCFRETRALRQQVEQADSTLVPLSTWPLHVCSENNFPTAAGLASSASGLAALVFTLAKLFDLPATDSELSRIARQGSGSACRSLFGGYVAWQMGEQMDGSDSLAVQVAKESHWPDMHALVCVVSDAKKGTSSTEGMQNTIETSKLMKERLSVVPERMAAMKTAISNKDFHSFAELTMQDSNQFHAVCLDTYPPIFYLNDTSRGIIRLIHEYNRSNGTLKAAYTYDAGPNAVVYTLKENVDEVRRLLEYYFPTEGSPQGELQPPNDQFNTNVIPVYPSGSVRQFIPTKVGGGPRELTEEHSLLDSNGTPKKIVSSS